MKKKTAITATVVALSALLLAGCPSESAEKYYVTGEYLTGKEAKKTYNAYIGSVPSTLDARVSQSAENISHLANFEDCLVMNDGYGILRKSLAATAERNADQTVFKFTIKENIPWVTCDGVQYEYRGEKQYVKAADFVTTAKNILDYNNNSEIYYMYTLFIKNAWEYYCYTMMAKWISEGHIENGFNYNTLVGNYAAQAVKLTELVKRFSNNDPDTPIDENRLLKISKFEEVGVKVVNNVLTYTLNQPAAFFPTMLTYTPYTPINSHFLAQHKTDYGTKRDAILYCGPFLLKEFTSESLRYEKNPLYWNKDYVHIDNVNYYAVDASLGYADQRKAFDEGRVDGFGLSKEDEVGWSMYIEGPDGTGTIQEPYSSLVNNRELDDVDYTYHFVLNPNRATDESSYKNSNFYNSSSFKGDPAADIANTNRALKLQEVRKLVLNGFDLSTFNNHYNAPERDQYQMNTFTPRGYVYDGSGTDYVDYYYAYFAEQKNLVGATATFDEKVAVGKKAVGPQQINGVNYTNDEAILAEYPWLSANNLVERAKKSVELYNEDDSHEEKISLPVNIEFLGVGSLNATEDSHEKTQVMAWNERANGCALDAGRAEKLGIPQCQTKDSDGKIIYPYFYMRLSQAASSDKLSTSANNGYYSIYTGWGWVGDYADPLTYVHCYVTNGEMSRMSGNNDDKLLSYRLSEDGTTLSEESFCGSYTAAVNAANEKRGNLTERYKAFAEVEYQLLNDLYLMRPVCMYTQGWSASVSRAAGYENPQAHYGLADNILAGMWVLVKTPTGDERRIARAHREQREAEELAKVNGNAINGAFDDYN